MLNYQRVIFTDPKYRKICDLENRSTDLGWRLRLRWTARPIWDGGCGWQAMQQTCIILHRFKLFIGATKNGWFQFWIIFLVPIKGTTQLFWSVVWNMKFMTFYILGISWSQLTFIFFRGVGIPPTRYYIDSNCLLFPDLVEVRYLTRLSILCFSWRVGTPILRWNMASGSSAPKNAQSGSTPFRWWFCSVWCPFCFFLLGRIVDTLVNVYITMENNNFSWKNSLFQWPWLQ